MVLPPHKWHVLCGGSNTKACVCVRRLHIAKLQGYNEECLGVVSLADKALGILRQLDARHSDVSTLAQSLHDQCRKLTAEQVRQGGGAGWGASSGWLSKQASKPVLTNA